MQAPSVDRALRAEDSTLARRRSTVDTVLVLEMLFKALLGDRKAGADSQRRGDGAKVSTRRKEHLRISTAAGGTLVPGHESTAS